MSEQAVANEAETEVKPSVEESGAQDDLDKILSEYEESEVKAETPKQPAQDDTSDVIEWVRQQRERENREVTQKDLKSATELMKEAAGETPVEIPDEIFEGLLYKRAETDPRITRAWLNRGTNPDGWNKVLKGLGKEVAEKFSNVDRKATDDWNSVESAVRSATTSTSSAPDKDWSGMTDAEFEMAKRKMGGY